MTTSELIAALQAMPPGARVIGSWEGELYNMKPDQVRLAQIHIDGYAPGYHREHDAGWCYHCDDIDNDRATEPGVIIG